MPDSPGGLERLRRMGWNHPEWWVVAVAAAAWVFMAGMALPRAADPHAGHAGHASHAGMIAGGGQGHGAAGMAAMVIAMMLPLTLANVRHVAWSSLWRRRHRAIAAFLAGYLAVWILVQAGIAGAWGWMASFTGWERAGIVALVAAVLWELSPIKRQRLHHCHRTVPLAPRGWRADADCARYGVTTGLSCVTMCWALMAACAAFAHSFLVMIVLFGVQLSGRYQRNPSPSLAALAVCGVYLLAIL
jgi:predicted metal-binding membrane protein